MDIPKIPKFEKGSEIYKNGLFVEQENDSEILDPVNSLEEIFENSNDGFEVVLACLLIPVIGVMDIK